MYYMLAPEGQYYNYSGCGNVINCNHPVVRRFIVDCLRYWVQVGAPLQLPGSLGVATLSVSATATLYHFVIKALQPFGA